MTRLLTIETLEERVGKPVYDPYKRRLGTLVSFDSEVDGRVTKVAIMTDDNRIVEYPAEAVVVEGDKIIIKPRWKIEAEKTHNNYRRALKRLKSLEEIYMTKHEIPEHIYKAFAERYEKQLRRLREQLVKVREMIRNRIAELEMEKDALIRTKTLLRISYMSGEVSHQAYRVAWEKIRMMEESIDLERKDLEKTLKMLEEVEEAKFLEKLPEKRSKEESGKSEATAPATDMQPIPVKIIG